MNYASRVSEDVRRAVSSPAGKCPECRGERIVWRGEDYGVDACRRCGDAAEEEWRAVNG